LVQFPSVSMLLVDKIRATSLIIFLTLFSRVSHVWHQNDERQRFPSLNNMTSGLEQHNQGLDPAYFKECCT